MKAFEALNNNSSCKTSISIQENDLAVRSFENVKIQICIGSKTINSYLLINVEEDDDTLYTNYLELKRNYNTKNSIMEYEETRDYQLTLKRLIIKPIGTEKTIIITLKPPK